MKENKDTEEKDLSWLMQLFYILGKEAEKKEAQADINNKGEKC